MKYLKPFKVNESQSMIDDWTVLQLIEMLTIELEDSKYFDADTIYLDESDLFSKRASQVFTLRYTDDMIDEQEVASLKLNQLKVVSVCILQRFTHGLVKDITDKEYKPEDGKSNIYTISQDTLQPEIAKIDKTVLDKIGRKYDFDVTIDRVSPWDYEKCEYEVKFTINTY